MTNVEKSQVNKYGSKVLGEIVDKLQGTNDPKRKYEYVLWLAKKLPRLAPECHDEAIRVKGCVSQVYILGELVDGRLLWKGDSDALITRGLLTLLINGLTGLTPDEVISIDPSFIRDTGLQGSLTPSRANGFLNILLTMKTIAKHYQPSTSTFVE